MARPSSEHPTEAELRILKVLWHESPKTVDEVRQTLADDDRELTHSSVITLMNIMVRKGCLLYTSPSPRDRQKSRMPSSA